VHQSGGAEMNPVFDQVQRSIEYVRARNQDHAWADRNEAQR
jgi:hypothetical protein